MLPTYWCQGHFTSCPDCRDPEGPGCDGHGVISYCDGSCSDALLLLEDDIRTHRMPAIPDSTDTITLLVSDCDRNPASYTVSFEGPDAQAWALAYMDARPGHHFTEEHLAPFDYETFPAMAARLHPHCHHGMALDLCMDPVGEHHFGTLEQEMANGW